MTYSKLMAWPGILCSTGCIFYVMVHLSAGLGLLALLCNCASWVYVGANADYWEGRYRSRNWGQGDSRFKQGHGNG
jgi:hypothetical protein